MNNQYEGTNWKLLCRRMVEVQLINRGVDAQRVLEAISAVPRHRFVPANLQAESYDDTPLPIGSGQTISQPYIVALMTSQLELKADDSVLEIGTGSGYQAAVLSHLVRRVFTVERIPSLAQTAAARLRELGMGNVKVLVGDGGAGLPQHAPFNAILVTAAAPQVPGPLIAQLADCGRVVAPIGSRHHQRLHIWVKKGGRCKLEKLTPVRFVPLTGAWGCSD